MRSTTFILAIALVAATPLYAAAASTVTGTVSCTALGEMWFGPPYLPEELAEPLTKPLRFRATSETSTCDGSGVAGARAPITLVEVRFGGKAGAETSCADFLGTVALTGKVKLRWRSHVIGGDVKTVGTSRATVASTTYDSGTVSFVVVTNPISGGAFVGSTVTMHFGLLDEASYADHCTTRDFRYAGFIFGVDNPWTIDVQ
jgi:hypothetical protein